MKKLKVGVTSQNGLKVSAVTNAYLQIGIPAEIIGYKADSGVGEQPVDEQTVEGARNRIRDIYTRISGLDRIISIENGIFREGEQWVDRAVVVIYNPTTTQEQIEYSDAVVFPDEYVRRAQQIGFNTITVGQVMAEAGYVADQKDPHFSISGISRKVYLENTVRKLVELVEKGMKTE